MTALPDAELSALDRHVIGRSTSFFHDDLAADASALLDSIRGSRILIIGAAGSIGLSTLRTLLHFEPGVLHLIDHNENGLAELVRSLRSSPDTPAIPELLTLPFDYGGAPFRHWIAQNGVRYDHVLNFAALKHVRSEKDPYSMLAMLETNVVHLDRLSRLLAESTGLRRVFSVSTDKAANPSSVMGATKRLMEHALFLPTQPWGDETAVSSARFANVAFSNGSLLDGWLRRVARHEPLACPDECRRFFVSLSESGHLCTLAAFLGSDRGLTVPAFEPGEHLVLLSDVAAKFLEFHGYEPHFTSDEDEALGRVSEMRSAGRWPVLITPLDTGGEKPYEEFVGVGETLRPSRFSSLAEVEYVAPPDPDSYARLVQTLDSILSSEEIESIDEHWLTDLIATVEPAFATTRRASSKSLDQRI